jgi:hypothetical protein
MRLASLWFGLSSTLIACSGTAPGQKPAAAPAAATLVKPAEDVHQIVRRLTSRTGANTEVTEGPAGIRVFQINQGMGQVVLARTNSDGSVSTKCVESEDESRAFLGNEPGAAR